MQEITQKLYKRALDDFKPIAEELAAKGHGKDDIVTIFQAQMRLKTRQYYEKKRISLSPVGDVLCFIVDKIPKPTADSIAESIFCDMLVERGLNFEFQYSIGPYRADYLFAGFLVVELDGPQHKKNHDDRRDKYMRDLGYKIIRVPIWILVSCPDAVVDEIQDAVRQYTIKNKLRKKRMPAVAS